MRVFMGFPICSLIFVVLLAIVYFSKPRLSLIENNIYKILLITNIIGLLLEIYCYWAVAMVDKYYLISMSILKLYVVYLFVWTMSFNMYVFMVSSKEDKEESRTIYFNKLKIISIIIAVIISIIMLILPLKIFNEGSAVYTYGPSVNLLLGICFIIGVIWTVMCIVNRKNIKNKKYIPVIACILVLIIIAVVQSYDRAILIATTGHSIICVLMFFTIENPDLKMLENVNILKKQAENANSVKNAFLRQMRHEMNTPATQVEYYNDFNRDIGINIKNDNIINNSKMVDFGIKDVKALVNNAVLIADLENKDFKLEEFMYKTSDVIDRITYTAKTYYRPGKEHLKYKANISKKLPLTLIGDYQNVEIIVLNLLSNAFKYTEKGKITLDVDVEIKDNICNLTFIITDTGIGIKKEDMKHLFNKFERIEFDSHQNDKRGAGLGLSIVKQLAELMDGNVKAQSTFGEGSTFTVNIKQKIVEGVRK